MNATRIVCGASAVLAIGASSAAQLPFPMTGVGDLPGGAFASRALGLTITPTGNIVVGESLTEGGWRAFRWTPAGGIQGLGVLSPNDQFSRASGIAADGTVIGSSGFAPAVYECQGFRWTAGGGMQALGPFAAPVTPSLPHAIGINGGVIVGQAGMNPGSPFAFRHTAAGIFPLAALPGGAIDNSAAHAVSGDGSVIVGYAQQPTFEMVATRWAEAGPGAGAVALGHLNSAGFRDSRAFGCTPSGSAIVGESTSPNGPREAFRWTPGAGMFGLGDLPGGAFSSTALAIDDEGYFVVGWSAAADGNRAFIWDPAHGMRDLRQVLLNHGWPVQGWTLTSAVAMRSRFIAGNGINPAGQPEGWLAHLWCYADCNVNGTPTIADFGCFQARFMAADKYADCNGDGQHTIADFACFQAKFVAALGGACQ